MKRLTSKRCNGIKSGYWSPAKKDELVERLAAYEDTGFEPEDLKKPFDADSILGLAAQVLKTTPERLRELVELYRSGRCVPLPCKVGDSVWILEPDECGDPCEVSGYICIGGNRVYSFLSPVINDEEEPMEICYYRHDDYVENGFLGDVIIWPWGDCYFSIEAAKKALDDEQEAPHE